MLETNFLCSSAELQHLTQESPVGDAHSVAAPFPCILIVLHMLDTALRTLHALGHWVFTAHYFIHSES